MSRHPIRRDRRNRRYVVPYELVADHFDEAPVRDALTAEAIPPETVVVVRRPGTMMLMAIWRDGAAAIRVRVSLTREVAA